MQWVNLLEVQLKLLPARPVFGILQIRPWWWCCSCITMTGEWKNQQKGVLGWSANSNFYRSEIFRLAWKRTGTQVCQTLTEDFIHKQAASICSESLNLVIPRCNWRNVSMRTRYSCGRNARVTKFRWNGTDQYTCSRLKPSLRNFVPIANPSWLWFLKRDWGRSGFQAFNSQLDFYHTRLYSDCLAKVCGRVSENGCWLLVHVVLKFAPIWFSYRILNRNDLFWGKR